MSRYLKIIFYVYLLITFGTEGILGASNGDYWPMWRGPQATGAAKVGNPPINWSEAKNIKWKVKLPGEGSSSPIVWDNKIFFLTAIPTGNKVSTETPQRQEQSQFSRSVRRGGGRRNGGMNQSLSTTHKFNLVCVDRKSGKILWQKTAREAQPHEGHQPNGSFASYSPVTDGKCVWVNFGSYGVYCYDIDGNHKWSRDLGKMRIIRSFGEGSSPTLAGNSVIIVMDHEDESFIYALNKDTGQTIWRKARDEATSWATPLAVEVDGKIQVITSASNRIRSYDVETGNVIWECGGQTRNVIPSPVTGFGKVFCTSGFRGCALQAIELGHTGDLTDSEAIKWQVTEGTPYVPSPLLYEGKLYICSVNQAIISCYQADTGKADFVKQRLEGVGEIYASPVGVSERVYFVGRSGMTKVIKCSDELHILATNILDDRFDASPAIVGDEIYLKGKENLYCIASQ